MKNMRETEQDTSGLPTGVANMGGGGAPQNLMGVGGGRGAQVKTWGEHGRA